jgi:hemerythrin-like domain-containing protein
MHRDKNLVPLSHQHQHALALCVRIGKAFEQAHATPDVHPWEREIVRQFDNEISRHFRAEEKLLFPAAAQHEELVELVDALRIEHTLLRRAAERARAQQFTVTDLQVFAASLSEHVRKEERQLFEVIENLLPAEELDRIGTALEELLNASDMPGASGSSPGSGAAAE